MTRFLDRVFLNRPLMLIPVWAAYLLGSRAARLEARSSLWPAGTSEWRWTPGRDEWEGLLLVTLVACAMYVLNQLVDVDVDRRNRKLFLLPDRMVSRRGAALQMAGLLLTATLLAAPLASREERILLALATAIGILYSAPPVRWKARAGFDVAANAISYGGIVYLLGWCGAGGRLGGEAVLHAIPYVFVSAALVLLSMLEDRAGDAAGGLRTSAVAWGERAIRRGTLGLAIAALLAAIAVREGPASWWAFLAMPLYAEAFRRESLERDFVANQIAGRFLVIVAVPGALVFGAMSVLVASASRSYYRNRFGFDYPRLSLHAERTVPRGLAEPSRVDTGVSGG